MSFYKTISVLKKINGNYVKIWETPITISGDYLTIKIKDLFNDDNKEILVSCLCGARSTSLFVYKWEGNSAKLLGKFIGDAIVGGIFVKKDEIIEEQYENINYYKWNGREYKLYKKVATGRHW